MDDPRDLQRRLLELFDPVARRMGLEVVAVELTGSDSRQVLRVSVDGPHGVEVGALRTLSRALSPLLDVEDPIPGAYDLEVSSPGIDRPLQRREDFERFTGYTARLRMDAAHPRRRYRGQLRGLRGDELLIEVDGQEHALPLEHVAKATLVLTLDEYQALGASRAPGAVPTEGGPS